MVLVDSSIWVNYFKKGDHQSLNHLLSENLIVTNDVILSELIPRAITMKELDIVDALNAIPKIEFDIDWNGIIKLQTLNIQNGINKVGLPDLLILQQVIQKKTTLWTLDKHFYLMQEHINFELY